MPALVRWEPFRDMRRVHDMLDRAFDEGLFGNAGEGLTLYEGLAPVDVYQTDEAIVVKASLPGVKPEDIDISVTGDTLTIRGEVTEEKSTRKSRGFSLKIAYRFKATAASITCANDAGTVLPARLPCLRWLTRARPKPRSRMVSSRLPSPKRKRPSRDRSASKPRSKVTAQVLSP